MPVGPELLIIVVIGLLLLIIPLVLAYLVYNDAQKRDNDNAALWALAVGALTFLTFFGGILVLVIYIWDRE
ncbi:hypothetical protein [Halorubrum sp. BOL3-1]|uniref:hypothetical protein n=1 Tax=Halorubrum sp. BOL3-1 TaxID=2497325 RepID=UPI001F4F6CEA|nr:hypothetical protein [Halorubrum sp. BOL3-1]